MSETRRQAEQARSAFVKLSTAVDRTRVLNEIANALPENAARIFEANQKDLDAAQNGGLAQPLYKRLIFDEPKLRDVIAGIKQVAAMDDHVTDEEYEEKNGQ